MSTGIKLLLRNKATVADIQRLEDASVNPFTGKAWPGGINAHKAIFQGRRKLPVYENAAKLLKMYQESQVFVLSSETGSGKSTQVPQLLAYDEYSSGLLVACTQPRRLAARKLANRVAEEMGVGLGEQVGYQIGGEKKFVADGDNKTGLSYITEGVLINQIMDDPDLSKYACVIIDDAHERTIDTDLLLAWLKQALTRRKDLKVIVISATINAEGFQAYFNDCPVLHIPGKHLKSLGQTCP